MISMTAVSQRYAKVSIAGSAGPPPRWFGGPHKEFLPLQQQQQGGGFVHIVERFDELRRTLAPLFGSLGLEVRTYRDCDAFLSAPVTDGPACLLLAAGPAQSADPELPVRLRRLRTRIPVVVVASSADVFMAVEAMKAGAIDFLEAPPTDEAVLQAVGVGIRADWDQRCAADRLAKLRTRYSTLTTRERQVMLMVSAGKLNKQVAGELGLSEITVKVHRGAAMRKMGAHTLAELVRMTDALTEIPQSAFGT
jgi:FixJ family two-component response regulator